MLDTVFLVHHVHVLPNGEEDVKLIGVYKSQVDAANAVARATKLPGFLESPDGFDINEYEVGKDQWIEGFFTWEAGQNE